jgi:asparagine synthase (glutamine-hydrolysing)
MYSESADCGSFPNVVSGEAFWTDIAAYLQSFQQGRAPGPRGGVARATRRLRELEKARGRGKSGEAKHSAMCGICGIAGERAEADGPVLARLLTALRHRGPDDSGRLLAPRIALGSRRLSIIDLPGGHQPIASEDGRVVVVFNGEISNFRELRRELEALGHRFATRADTETIVHAYEEWGEDCPSKLDGMFAFAVAEFADADQTQPLRLLLARDRLGIKPLYYTVSGGQLIFASEVRALLASGAAEGRISPDALATYLFFGSVSEPATLVEHVASLPPAHRLLLRLDRPVETVEPRPYWRLAAEARRRREMPGKNADQAARETRERLESAVRSHLAADVPLGVFLSSGMDSTALAALASRESAGAHTFTLIFTEEEFSEARQATATARRFGTNHQQLLLRGEEVLACHEQALLSLDQPSMDGINTWFVSRAARQAGLKVALSGLGGDELFGGYETFRSAPMGAWITRNLPAAARRPAGRLLKSSSSAMGRPDRGRKLASLLREPSLLPHPYFFTRLLFPPDEVRGLIHHDGGFAGQEWLREAVQEAGDFDDFSMVSQLEIRGYMVNTLLRDTDAMSMAHSLEVRVPLLDRELVEYVVGLPEKWKRRRGARKSLLADALGDLLPPEVVAQPKRTFTLPWERWLRGPLQSEVEAGLAEPASVLEPFLDRAAVRKVWQDFLARRTSWSRPWSLYVLNRWARRYLDDAKPARIDESTAEPAQRIGGMR